MGTIATVSIDTATIYFLWENDTLLAGWLPTTFLNMHNTNEHMRPMVVTDKSNPLIHTGIHGCRYM